MSRPRSASIMTARKTGTVATQATTAAIVGTNRAVPDTRLALRDLARDLSVTLPSPSERIARAWAGHDAAD